ncbi:MAG: glycosyl hydrolase [Candidatus Eremiobacteraeota bacterium]|nr:glycosyl hydrolase [Candidatus Eremiobacteraeota bacterium]
MKRLVASVIVAAFAVAPGAAIPAPSNSAAQSLLSKLQWRSIGPYIGGRVVAVAGVPDQPNLFYMGAVQGGVWKSENAGTTWDNISDGQMGSLANGIGAIAVAPSNSKILYAGTGESDIRQDFASGDGIYTSTDAGKTWHYAGLRETRQTSSLVIDPRNPDVVYATSMGHVFRPNPDRGVYKTTDGGKTWKKILFVDDNTGANNIVMDGRNPNVLYATTWEAQRTAWGLTSGGPGSAIYKSTDAGAHWTKISTNPGFAHGTLGKLGVAVAPNNSRVVYAMVQADDGGVFRSDDAGATWKRVNDEWKLRQRAFYYMSIYVDPTNWRVAYAPNVDSVFKTADGGRTWQPLGPGLGDNHIVWINPRNPKIMIIGDDGGANVSLDGGKTFSTTLNQPTGQFYHIALDDQFPYHVYGAQQDEGAYELPSASNEGLGPNVVHTVALGESTYVAVDPRNPTVTYGAGYFSALAQLDYATGEEQNVSPWAVYKSGLDPKDVKYRFGWTHPVTFSPAEPHSLFETAQVVFRSDDFGQTWKAISPDLTRNDKSTEGTSGGPVYPDQTGAETFPDIASLGLSPANKDVIWAGSADGLVHVTTDGGASWKDVTPKNLPEWTQISSIEPSRTDAATAFISASRYMWDDMRPYIYKTTDYGAHWTPTANGIPQDQSVFAVRVDPREPRVMFAGTRSTVYVSLNGGLSWQALSLNLPVTEVRDIQIDARQGQVAIATHGRAFWILDNLAFIEDLARASSLQTSSAQLFQPETAWITHAYGGGGGGANAGDNPEYGATIYYNLPANYNGRTPATLAFVDASGKTVHSFSLHLKQKKEKELSNDRLVAMDALSVANYRLAQATAAEPGMNNFQWDLSYAPPTEIRGAHLVPTDDFHDDLEGATVLPGDYTVVLNYGGTTIKQPLKVQLDPRFTPSTGALEARLALATQYADELNTLNSTTNAALAKRGALSTAKRTELDRVIAQVVDFRFHSSEGDAVYPTEMRDYLAFQMNSLDLTYRAPTPAQQEAYNILKSQTDELISQMKSIAGL